MTHEPDSGAALLEVKNLVKHYGTRRAAISGARVRAVDDVSFSIRPGETLGLVGESGCGKSTLARLLVRLEQPTSGQVFFGGDDLAQVSKKRLREVRREIQMVFQDPYSSLNPRYSVQEIVEEPFRVHRMRSPDLSRRVGDLLEQVGLSRNLGRRFPHEFSGGQRQRIAIARALALRPKLVVLDEPVSALDVSVQAQIVNLLKDLQAELGLAYLFISHDLSIVENISHRVATMYLGRIVEEGECAALLSSASHPYTQALLSAVPIDDPRDRGRYRRIILEGDIPDPSNPPSGCSFRTRCWKAVELCAELSPELAPAPGGRTSVACHHAAPTSGFRELAHPSIAQAQEIA
jgi:oligopeptide/dipeptide ABC transporter ATP-binding protein